MALTRLGGNQSINLSSNTTGTLGVANGGTGLTSGTTDQFLKFTGTTTVASAAVSTTAPSETNFLARGGANYEPSLADNTTTLIVLPNEDYDTHNGYNTSTGKYTIASGQAGQYFFFAKMTMTNGTDRADADISIYKNNSFIGNGKTYISSPDNYPAAVPSLTAAQTCAVGDEITIKYYQDLGGSYPETANYSVYFGGFKIS
jgi:hypothetical protein